MNVSGFTFVRNGCKFDYPFGESIRSLLPLVDELIVSVGKSEDETLERVRQLAKEPGGEKLRISETVWPLSEAGKLIGGQILADQTNIALAQCTGDWCIYLQADEVLHEDDAPRIREALQRADADPRVEGLLFDYVHFYGSYDVIQQSRSAYRREVRAIRRSARPRSVGDAQSFRAQDGSKLGVIQANARVFHYGWVRTPEAMREKTVLMDQLYHGTKTGDGGQPATGRNYLYKRIIGLKRFQGTHPAVMRERIGRKGWHWDLDASPLEWTWKDAKKVVLDAWERLTGQRLFEYRSYRLLHNTSGTGKTSS